MSDPKQPDVRSDDSEMQDASDKNAGKLTPSITDTNSSGHDVVNPSPSTSKESTGNSNSVPPLTAQVQFTAEQIQLFQSLTDDEQAKALMESFLSDIHQAKVEKCATASEMLAMLTAEPIADIVRVLHLLRELRQKGPQFKESQEYIAFVRIKTTTIGPLNDKFKLALALHHLPPGYEDVVSQFASVLNPTFEEGVRIIESYWTSKTSLKSAPLLAAMKQTHIDLLLLNSSNALTVTFIPKNPMFFVVTVVL